MTQLCFCLKALIKSKDLDENVVECYFLEALYCSLGATLLEKERKTFDDFIKGLSDLPRVNDEHVLAVPGQIPGKDLRQRREVGMCWAVG